MNCEIFDQHCLGDIAEEEFTRHLETCAECQRQVALDGELNRRLGELRRPMHADGLWQKIEASLIREKELQVARNTTPAGWTVPIRGLFSRRWAILVPATAVVLILIAIGIIQTQRPKAPSGLLTHEALVQVELKEKEYLGAIEQLEQQATPKIAAMDPEMMSLYRDKLATIDMQITRCREALEKNPGNAHIRRYLLAALHDKRMTLTDALGSTT